MKKLYCVICGQYKKLEKPKISYLKTLVFLLFEVSVRVKMKNYLKKKNRLKY